MSNYPGAALSQKQSELSDAQNEFVDSLNLSPFPTLNRVEAVTFLNEKLGIPFRQGAVARAYDNKELPSALISGKALASERDLACWAMSKFRNVQAG